MGFLRAAAGVDARAVRTPGGASCGVGLAAAAAATAAAATAATAPAAEAHAHTANKKQLGVSWCFVQGNTKE